MVRIAALILALLGALPAGALAQSASLRGIVSDTSQAVVPGVTVTATEVASGREYTAVSDEKGEYVLASVPPGTYRVQATLDGFGTALISSLELLVGQAGTLPLVLKPAGVEEAVTVTGEVPLVNTRSAVVGGNIDRRQMKELPVLGRNWLEMSLLVKGITANSMVGGRAGMQRDDQFQLNLDGQQVTQNISLSDSFGQPRISREAIAEYALSTSGYDVTQGRSVGVQVQAVSRSGTNDLHGSAFGNFRDDAFTAPSFISRRVVPFSNTQVGGSLGGPIITSKLHYFAAYEYEREPNTSIINPQEYLNAPVSLITMPTTVTQHNFLARGDYQMGPKDHVNVRGSFWDLKSPNAQLGSRTYPAGAVDTTQQNLSIVGTWSRVVSNNIVQEVKAGYTQYEFANVPASGVPLTPVYTFAGTSFPDIGASRSYPQAFFQNVPSVRYDLTWHRGSHDLKIGGEYLLRRDGALWENQARGVITISGTVNGPLSAAEYARRFPLDAWNDASRWDLSGLLGSRLQQNFARDFTVDLPRKTWAIWLADTWQASDRLTVNYGVRWDVDWGALDPPGGIDTPIPVTNGFDPANSNFGYTTGIRDFGNVGPRAGLTFKVNDRLILRGGAGLFYTFQESNMLTGPQQQITNVRNVVSADISNTGNRPDFVTNPLGSITPEQILDGTVPRPRIGLRTLSPDYRNPRTLQATAGFQQQLGDVFGFDADLMYTKGMNLGTDRDVNLFYDPVTGYPKNPSAALFDRPLKEYGAIRYFESNLKSEQLALATSFTRRLRNNWQMGGTYTLMFSNNDHNLSGFGYIASFSNPFCTTCEWGQSGAFQRHTVRLNGIYEAPWGISVSGIYSFGSGNPQLSQFAASSTYPVGTGSLTAGTFQQNRYVTSAFTMPETVTYPDGSVHNLREMLRDGTPITYQPGDEIPRNALMGRAFSKLDLRLSKAVTIPSTSIKVTGMVEVFNVLNHANYTSYNFNVNVDGYGRPTAAGAPRTGQLAFRVDF